MRPAVIGVMLVLLNQILFIQARIAMLDVFLGVFVTWAMVMMLWAMKGTPRQALWRWVVGSALLGLAVGVKWAAIPYEALAGLAFLVLRLRDLWPAGAPSWSYGLARALKAMARAKAHRLWPGLGTIQALLIMGGVSILVYFLTFLPAFFYARDPMTIARLIPYQFEMYAPADAGAPFAPLSGELVELAADAAADLVFL
ncbi:MAG: phospholipid carrier-dependent glycosyltransferase [Sphingomonas sp.]